MDQKPAEYVRVTMRKSKDEYAMHTETHALRRLTPKLGKKARVRARRKAAKVQGW